MYFIFIFCIILLSFRLQYFCFFSEGITMKNGWWSNVTNLLHLLLNFRCDCELGLNQKQGGTLFLYNLGGLKSFLKMMINYIFFSHFLTVCTRNTKQQLFIRAHNQIQTFPSTLIQMECDLWWFFSVTFTQSCKLLIA